MIKDTTEFLEQNEVYFEKRKAEILNTKDTIKITGTAFYVANDGDDNNDGKSVNTAWKTIQRVNEAVLEAGDGIFFKRGDLFRGGIEAVSGVTYAAYGEGNKPKLYSGPKNLADKELWELYDKEHNIWKLKMMLRDVGVLVFNDGEAHTRKMIPTFKDGSFVLRDNPDVVFDMARDMTNDLDLYWLYKGEFSDDGIEPIIILYTPETLGEVYLRSDKGNPGEVYSSIEASLRINGIRVSGKSDVTVDNLCIKHVGAHGVGAGGFTKGLTVTNCEFGWIGGSIQYYHANRDNPKLLGRIVRYGNAVEIYGGCKDYTVCNNYIYEAYDAGITYQFGSTKKVMMEDILFSDNIVEKCVYAIEYWLGQACEDKGKIKNCLLKNNILRLTGYGWGKQRYNPETPAALKTFSAQNASENYVIKDNIFDRGTQNFFHIAAEKVEHCPKMEGNTYIQHLNGPLGRYGSNKDTTPELHTFDMYAEEKINNIFGDKTAKVYYIEE